MGETKGIWEVLHDIQIKLKAPKDQGGNGIRYKYRKAEDILESVKPLLPESYVVLLSDKLVEIGGKNYIQAQAELTGSSGTVSVRAYAREADSPKGMSEAQLTGSTSSYARKYALNGLFAIDNTDVADDDEIADGGGDKKDKKAKSQLTGYQKADVLKALMYLNNDNPEDASSMMHNMTNKSSSSALTQEDIDRVMPELKELVARKVKNAND